MIDLFTLFTDRLTTAGVDYVVTGSVAAMVYGEPRLTHDIDLVVMLRNKDVDAFVAAFPDDDFYCAPAEVIRLEVNRGQRGHFNVIHHETGYKADIYLCAVDALHQWAFAHRRQLTVGGTKVWVAPPEYVIVRKLEYYREGGSSKHLSDIAGMLKQSGTELDFSQLDRFIAHRGLQAQWAEVEANR